MEQAIIRNVGVGVQETVKEPMIWFTIDRKNHSGTLYYFTWDDARNFLLKYQP